MRRRIVAVAMALGCAALMAACAASTPPPAQGGAALPEHGTPTPPATLALPAHMPTAAPLWTPTPATPSATAAPAPAAGEGAIVATVNGVPIAREDWERQVRQAESYLLPIPGTDLQTAAGQEALRRVQEQVLEWMIDQLLIEEAARQAGISVKPEDIEAQIALMRRPTGRGDDPARFEAWLSANGLTLELLHRQVRADLLTAAMRDLVTAQIPRHVAQFRVRHIMVSDKVRAQAALARIRGGESLSAVARQVSEDETTRNSGGDLGFLPKGVMPPAFEAAAYALQPGEVSGVVQSEFGYHVVQLVEADPNLRVPDDLWPVVQQRGFEDWLAGQRANATIQRIP